METKPPSQTSLHIVHFACILAVLILAPSALPGCGGRPEREAMEVNVSPATSAKPNPPRTESAEGRRRATRDSDDGDSSGSLFDAVLRVADQAEQIATRSASELTLQGFIEVAADSLRTGLNAGDEALPSLDPDLAKRFGDDFRNSVISVHGRVTDRPSQALVVPIWEEVVTASGESPSSLTITLVDDSAINAFAFVGRNIMVNQGFIDFARGCERTDDVIRFAMAHELGHIACGHTDTLFRRLVAADQIVPGAGVAPIIVASIVKQTPVNQAAEREADCFARRLHLANGWSLEGGIEFFRRVWQMSGRPSAPVAIDSLFGSHPQEGRRIELLKSGAGCKQT